MATTTVSQTLAGRVQGWFTRKQAAPAPAAPVDHVAQGVVTEPAAQADKADKAKKKQPKHSRGESLGGEMELQCFTKKPESDASVAGSEELQSSSLSSSTPHPAAAPL